MKRNPIPVFVRAAALGVIALCAVFSQAASGGVSVFKTKCAACHGADGKSDGPVGKKLGAHDLSSTDVQGQSDEQLTEVVTKGKNKMPAYGDKLTKDQIAELVVYIRELGKKH